ncbi:hypothetical protein [Paraglaciecola sp.]|uniref:hypothetical protein n=1 Tax=Paraglaciecola sp. TaxID=1920173 RepID=UPI0032667E33
MNESLEEIFNGINAIVKDIALLRELLSTIEITAGIKDSFDRYDSIIPVFEKVAATSQIDENVFRSAKNLLVHAGNIGSIVSRTQNITDEIKELADHIKQTTREIIKRINARPATLGEFDDNLKQVFTRSIKNEDSLNSNGLPIDIQNELKLIMDNQKQHDNRIKKLLSENESRISLIGEKAKEVEQNVEEKLDAIQKAYDDSINIISEKQEQIDSLLSHASGKTVAGDFDKSAVDEKSMADNLRFAAIFCMTLIVLVVGYSFWETTTDSFNLFNSLFRVVLAIFLSVPAAYLARESAKHREQQYIHLQTSLDLKSITPYLASLPEDKQHLLKIDIAKRIFGPKNFSKENTDSYPINTHELILEILKKFEIPKEKPQRNGRLN